MRRREMEMLKRERQLAEEEEVEVILEEKRLEEDERRLHRLRDELAKTKTGHREDLAKLQDQRTNLRLANEVELNKQRILEREAKELLTVEKQRLEGEQERRRAKKRITDMDIQNKENEVENMKTRLMKDREEYETDFRDR